VVSTTDDVDTPAGRVVTVLALEEQSQGRAGSYGAAGNAQAPVPSTGTS
jgi:copper transport outer membrane protein MctB